MECLLKQQSISYLGLIRSNLNIFHFCSELVGNEKLTRDTVINQLRAARISGVDEYMELSGIFMVHFPSEDNGINKSAFPSSSSLSQTLSPLPSSTPASQPPSLHLGVVARMKWLAQSHDHYLRVEYSGEGSTRELRGGLVGSMSKMQQLSSGSNPVATIHDSDIVMSIFLHMCDSLYESTSRVHHR